MEATSADQAGFYSLGIEMYLVDYLTAENRTFSVNVTVSDCTTNTSYTMVGFTLKTTEVNLTSFLNPNNDHSLELELAN